MARAPLPTTAIRGLDVDGYFTREWYLFLQGVDDALKRFEALEARFSGSASLNALIDDGILELVDGVAAPADEAGKAKVFVDTADGDLKVVYGDAVTKLIVGDT